MADTDVTLGFVHRKTLEEALTDSVIHQGKIYFPTDDCHIVKNGKKYGVPVIDLAEYAYEGAVLPTIKAIFVSFLSLVHYRTIYDFYGEIESGKDNFYHVFCCIHDAEYQKAVTGYKYYVYKEDESTGVITYFTTYNTYNGNVVPDIILRAFGEANVTTERDGLMPSADYCNMMACTNGLEYEVSKYTNEEGLTTVPLSLRKGDRLYVELVSGTKDPDASDDYEIIGLEGSDDSVSESFDCWITADVNSSELKISTYTTDKATIRLFIKRKPFTK